MFCFYYQRPIISKGIQNMKYSEFECLKIKQQLKIKSLRITLEKSRRVLNNSQSPMITKDVIGDQQLMSETINKLTN